MRANRGKRISEAEFSRLWHDEKLTRADIGAMLGITPMAVSQRARTRGLSRRRWRQTRKVSDIGLFKDMWSARVMTEEIAAHFGVSTSYPPRLALELLLPPRGRGWRSRYTVQDFMQDRLATQMASSAAKAQRAMIAAEMADYGRDGRPVGWLKAMGVAP